MRPRSRALQLGFLAAGVGAVVVADRLAGALGVLAGGAAGRLLTSLLPIGGRIVAGWAAGMAVRLQLAPAGTPDRQLRLLVLGPAAVVCGWALLAAFLPAAALAALPSWSTTLVLEVVDVVAVLLGLFLAVSVRPAGRRRS